MLIKPRAKEWRAIPGFPNYETSDVGHIRRVRPGKLDSCGRVLNPWVEDGSLCYTLTFDGEPREISEHVAVCSAFHGPRPTPRHGVAHADGNKQNNSKDNLRWATPLAAARWTTTLTAGAVAIDGAGPHAFLAAISRSERVLIDGVELRPTALQRRKAATHLRCLGVPQGASEKMLTLLLKERKGKP